MSGATNKRSPHFTADCRKEDARLGESLSIENQGRLSFWNTPQKNHFPNPVFFVDDGYSGTN